MSEIKIIITVVVAVALIAVLVYHYTTLDKWKNNIRSSGIQHVSPAPPKNDSKPAKQKKYNFDGRLVMIRLHDTEKCADTYIVCDLSELHDTLQSNLQRPNCEVEEVAGKIKIKNSFRIFTNKSFRKRYDCQEKTINSLRDELAEQKRVKETYRRAYEDIDRQLMAAYRGIAPHSKELAKNQPCPFGIKDLDTDEVVRTDSIECWSCDAFICRKTKSGTILCLDYQGNKERLDNHGSKTE